MLFTQDNVTKLDVKQIAEDMQEIKESLGLIDLEADNLSGFKTKCGDNIGLDIRSCFKTYFTGLEEIYEEAPEVSISFLCPFFNSKLTSFSGNQSSRIQGS